MSNYEWNSQDVETVGGDLNYRGKIMQPNAKDTNEHDNQLDFAMKTSKQLTQF